jgi:S-adenosylmethionine:tRNA ribosyltransferase-isomerase
MRRADFHYDLPPELIAQSPPAERGGGRMLVLDRTTGARADAHFSDFETLISPADLLVFNDTRVVPARVTGTKDSGGRVEVMLERICSEHEALVQIRSSRSPRTDSMLHLSDGETARVLGREHMLFRLEFESEVQQYFERSGSVPLPPYIERAPTQNDTTRYQTVFASVPGAVAAPTAGLHFDRSLIERLRGKGIESAFVTLHVGSGTFAPLREDRVEANRLHEERVIVSADVCDAVTRARKRGGRVVAIGTTAVRALETASSSGELRPFSGDSRRFIYPGYDFAVVDALLTNFHLPQSSLLMLVAAFAGVNEVLSAYRHAVAQRYRFFSYGDAMFIAEQALDHAI